MSERKVLTKYYPPDFDPSKLERRRGPKQVGPKVQTVRLMAPFSMKCISCGEYIYKGRKFNARKETTEDKYYAITIFRFYIRCTRCSAEITFKTDPKNMDYECEKGAKRNFEPWREAKLAEETEEERLDRIARQEEERDAMKDLEKKTLDAKTEMAIADALDDVRERNAARERAAADGGLGMAEVAEQKDKEAERVEREIEEQARLAFQSGTGEKVRRLGDEEEDQDRISMPPPAVPTFQRQVKEKKPPSWLRGMKKTVAAQHSSAVVSMPQPAGTTAASPASSLSLGLGDYSDDDD